MRPDYQRLASRIEGRVTLGAMMKQYTTWKIGGPADCLAEPASADDVAAILAFAKEEGVPVFVFGNGSNLLVKDGGIEGIAIRVGDRLSRRSYRRREDGSTVLTAESGLILSKMARETAKKGLRGLEWAVGIPASLGGAATMNAGAYGHCFYESLIGAEVVTCDGDIRRLGKEELTYSYRHTALMDLDAIVTEVELLLRDGDREELIGSVEKTMALRREKQPLELPSAGSVFKNPEGSHAGYLVEQTGLRGRRVGNARVSEKHGNFILNLGGASAEDVLRLIDVVRFEVKKAQGYDLEPEVRVVGRDKAPED